MVGMRWLGVGGVFVKQGRSVFDQLILGIDGLFIRWEIPDTI